MGNYLFQSMSIGFPLLCHTEPSDTNHRVYYPFTQPTALGVVNNGAGTFEARLEGSGGCTKAP